MRKQRACDRCGKISRNKKYCSRSCAVYINNTLYHRKENKRICKKCQITTTPTKDSKYCLGCNRNYVDWSTVTIQDLRTKLPNIQVHARIRNQARDSYRKVNKHIQCANCEYNKHTEVCHIKPISDFPINTSIATINHLSNLKQLCPNCHWELDNSPAI